MKCIHVGIVKEQTFIEFSHRLWCGSPTTPVPWRKGKESGNYPVYRAACLITPKWHWNPRGFWENCWSSVYIRILKKFWYLWRIASVAEWMDLPVRVRARARSKVFLLPWSFMREATIYIIRTCGPDLGWVFLPQRTRSKIFLMGMASILHFYWF